VERFSRERAEPKLCAVCAREARGFGYCHGLRWDRHPYHRFCSRRCQDVGSAIAQRNNGMIDKTAREARAIRDARTPFAEAPLVRARWRGKRSSAGVR
jgi:hypothetical protein